MPPKPIQNSVNSQQYLKKKSAYSQTFSRRIIRAQFAQFSKTAFEQTSLLSNKHLKKPTKNKLPIYY